MNFKTTEYKLCKINDSKGDLSKRWFLSFYVFSKKEAKVIRVIKHCPAEFKTATTRMRWLHEQKTLIDHSLKSGVQLEDNEPQEVAKPILMKSIMLDILKEKQNGHRKRGAQTAVIYFKRMSEFLEENKLTNILCTDFTTKLAYECMTWIGERESVKSNRTYNNFLNYFKSIFSEFIKRELISKNPFKNLVKKTEEQALNTPYSDSQKKDIISKCENTDLEFFIKFIYYTCARPNEIRQLKIENIMPDRILIPGTISKNKKNAHILITNSFAKVLKTFIDPKTPKHFYIFSKNGKSGHEMVATNHFYNQHKKILDQLEIKNQTLYSWKDTGACDLYVATKDIEFVSRHLRHHSLDMTKVYLRSLGVLTDKTNLANAPEL